jgi:hypothetical protein
MQTKWEYYIDAREMNKGFMDTMGASGWELVSFVRGAADAGQVPTFIFVYKRPLQ